MFTLEIILCIAIIAIIFLNYSYIKHIIVSFICFRNIPGPPASNIIIGNILQLHTSPDKIISKELEWSRLYYPVYNIRVLHINAANIVNPEDCESVLSNSKHIEKSFIYTLLHNWLGTGLLTSGGKKWQTRRRILTPAFHFNILQQFINVFNEETEELVETLKELSKKSSIEITPLITQFTLKSIAETAMGIKLKFDNQKEVAYKKAIFDMGEILLYRLLHTWFLNPVINMLNPDFFRERRAVKTLHRFTEEVICEREKNFKDIVLPLDEDEVYVGKKRLAMLDLLLSSKSKEGVIDDEGIREEVDTFMFEGHDTTSVALGFALMLIACNPEVQDLIVQEVKQVLGDSHTKPTYTHLQEMKYLERVIKEVLRMYPSVPFISRQLGEDLVSKHGYTIPKGSLAHIQIYCLHHNPQIYPDPEKFDPDRFLPENSKSRHPFAYIPFSAGPRNCIGQRFAMLELKAALSGVLVNFVLEPVDTPDSVVLVADLVIRTRDGIRVKLVPRLNL